jgi:hypothetical protein
MRNGLQSRPSTKRRKASTPVELMPEVARSTSRQVGRPRDLFSDWPPILGYNEPFAAAHSFQ